MLKAYEEFILGVASLMNDGVFETNGLGQYVKDMVTDMVDFEIKLANVSVNHFNLHNSQTALV